MTIVDTTREKLPTLFNSGFSLRLTGCRATSGANHVIIATPKSYKAEKEKSFTYSLKAVSRAEVAANADAARIIVRSAIPSDFVEYVRGHVGALQAIFSPELLRVGRALYDNLIPSPITVSERPERPHISANPLFQCEEKLDVEITFTTASEAEAIKLFVDTSLAVRVALFNELDCYAIASGAGAHQIIDVIGLDLRTGRHYNNASSGYRV